MLIFLWSKITARHIGQVSLSSYPWQTRRTLQPGREEPQDRDLGRAACEQRASFPAMPFQSVRGCADSVTLGVFHTLMEIGRAHV